MKHAYINALVSAREAKEKADAAYQEYLDKSPEFKAVEEARAVANKALKEAEGEVRRHYGDVLVGDGKEALPDGIGVRYSKVATFLNRAAYGWALKHGHIFLDINSSRVEKALIAGIIPLDMLDMLDMFGYAISDKPTITIAKDLKAVEDE